MAEESKRKDDAQEDLHHISTTHRKEFQERRKIEWKVLTGTLSFYVLVVSAAYAGRFTLPGNWLVVALIAVASFLFAGAATSYLGRIHEANSFNKLIAEAAENEIIRRGHLSSVKEAVDKAKREGRHAEGTNWSIRWQLIVIFSFAAAAVALLSGNLDWGATGALALSGGGESDLTSLPEAMKQPDILMAISVHAAFYLFLLFAFVKDMLWKRPGKLKRGDSSWSKFYLVHGMLLLLLYQVIGAVQVQLAWNFLPLVGILDFLAVAYLAFLNGWFRNWILGRFIAMEQRPE